MKTTLIGLLVVGLLAGCDGEGMPAGGEDAGAGIDTAPTTVEADARPSVDAQCEQLSIVPTVFGHPCLLRVPPELDCVTVEVSVGSMLPEEVAFSRSCDGAEPQLMLAGAACSRAEAHAQVLLVGCLNQARASL